MKFLVIDFDVIERGGINRIVEGLKYGLESAGCKFDYYWASRGGKLRSLSPDVPTMVNDRYYRLPAQQLSYGKRTSEDVYRKLLKQYDVVLFALPCPHDIKGKNGDMSWTMLYEVAAEAGKPIVGIIHDNLWDRYYEWYRQVSDLVKFHLFTCYQSKYDSLSRLPGSFVFLPTPLDIRKAGLYPDEKNGQLCWMPQWKKWKGIYQFLAAMPDINYPIDLYNSGIEYHNARQDESGLWKKAIGLNHVNKTKGKGHSTHQYWGSQLPEAIPEIYKSHRASIDLSGSIGERFDGQTSCVMFEAMVYGCVSVVHDNIASHPWSPLTGQDVVWTVPSDPSGIAEQINQLLSSQKRQKRLSARAFEFVTGYSDARQHAYTLLEFLSKDIIRDPEHPAVFYDDICSDPVPIHDFTVYEKKPYTSKHIRPLVVVDENEEVIEEDGRTVSMAVSGIGEQIQSMVGVNASSGSWMRFVTKVARAWLEEFGS